MTNRTRKPMQTLGLDLGDRYSHFCALDSNGRKLEGGRVQTTEAGMRKAFEGRSRCRVALEVGTHSAWVRGVLVECGHEVLVANPRKVRAIAWSDRKSDRFDAEMLARIARVDPKLLHPIQHRGPAARSDLALLRSRDILVETRTKLVSHVRGVVKAFGARLPRCSADCFHKTAPKHLPDVLSATLLQVVRQVGAITETIKAMDKQVEQLCRDRYPETKLLRQVHGVGPVTALCYVLTLEDPGRFKKSRQVGPYLGLVPRRRESGQSNPQLRITKAGDVSLRRLLVSCAQYILGPFGRDSDLRRWGLELAATGGGTGKKRAVVAVARKLAVLLHHLWKTGEVLQPVRDSATVATTLSSA